MSRIKTASLLPGSFGQVHFATGNSVPRITIPVNAMLFRAEGPQVAVVGKDGKMHCAQSASGKTSETRSKFSAASTPTDQIIINPSDSLRDGQTSAM